MADVTVARIEELETLEGYLEGIKMRRAAAELGVTAFGMSIIELAPGTEEFPEHDHSAEGLGGKVFANRPQQLGQEEVYVALRGSGTVQVDGESYPLDQEHIVRLGPTAKRKVIPGPEGLRLLALGGIPGSPYDPGGSG